MKTKYFYLRAATLALLILMFAACKNSKDDLPLWMIGLMGEDKTLTAVDATLVSIAVTPDVFTLTIGLNQQLSVTGTFDNGMVLDISSNVTWSSNNTSIATVDANGLVTAVTAGTTTITADYNSGTFTGTATVTAALPVITSISITPANPVLYAGVSKSGPAINLTATANYNDGSTKDVTLSSSWASTDVAVASVTLGQLKPLTPGTATISALTQGVTGTTTVTVLLDDEPPVFTGLNFTGTPSGISGEYVGGDVITVSADVTDLSNISTVTFFTYTEGDLDGANCTATLVSGNKYECAITLIDLQYTPSQDISYIRVYASDILGNIAYYDFNPSLSMSDYSIKLANKIYNQDLVLLNRGFAGYSWLPTPLANLTVNAGANTDITLSGGVLAGGNYYYASFDAVSGTNYTIHYDTWNTDSINYTGNMDVSAYNADGSKIFFQTTTTSTAFTATQTGKIYIHLDTISSGLIGVRVTSP